MGYNIAGLLFIDIAVKTRIKAKIGLAGTELLPGKDLHLEEPDGCQVLVVRD